METDFYNVALANRNEEKGIKRPIQYFNESKAEAFLQNLIKYPVRNVNIALLKMVLFND